MDPTGAERQSRKSPRAGSGGSWVAGEAARTACGAEAAADEGVGLRLVGGLVHAESLVRAGAVGATTEDLPRHPAPAITVRDISHGENDAPCGLLAGGGWVS